MRSDHHLAQVMESVASHEYQEAGRDPMSCLLPYAAMGGSRVQVLGRLFALDSQKVMAGLVDKVGRRDRDGVEARRSAMDTGYMLLSRHSHVHAAGFFLLGGSPSTAVRTLFRTAHMPMMALVVARMALHSGAGGVDRTIGGRQWGSLAPATEPADPGAQDSVKASTSGIGYREPEQSDSKLASQPGNVG